MVTLAFVGLIVLFFLVDYLFIKDLEPASAGHAHGHGEPDATSASEDVVLPQGYHLHPGHSWARMGNGGEVTVGVDDVAQATVSRVTGVGLPETGKKVEAGQSAFELTVGGRALKFVSPVTGVVTRVNTELVKNPQLINTDPYGAGWLFSVNSESTKIALPSDDAAVSFMKSDLKRLQEFIAVYRKGASYRGMLTGANNRVWNMFQEGFLSRRATKEA